MRSTSLRSSPMFLPSIAIAIYGAACSLSLDGPDTSGDRGRTRWQLQDGLRGGGLLGLDCALDVPIAEGAEPSLVVTPQNGATLAGAMYLGEGALTVTTSSFGVDDDGNESASVRVRGTSAGVGTIVVIDAAGAELDRVSMRVASAVALVCGQHTEGNEDRWTFPDLVASDAIELSLAAMSVDQRLACRATDASGDALLTVRAIAWTVESGRDVVTLSDDAFGESGSAATGARIQAEPLAEGEATLRVRILDVERRLTLSITP